MDDEDLQLQRARDEDEVEEIEEPRLTILQSFGLVVLLMITQLLCALLVRIVSEGRFDEAAWQNIVITHALSGFLTAKAGAILAGFSLAALFIPFRVRWQTLLFVILCGAGMTILSSELSNVLQKIQPISPAYLELFNRLFLQNRVGVILGIGVIAPITEEMIFRGVILEGLRKHYPLTTAFFFSTFLFAIVHILPWLIINAFLVGCFLAWLKLRTQSLILCIVTHAMYNSVPFILAGNLSVDVPGFTTVSSTTIQFQPVWFDLTGLALLGAGMAGIYMVTRNIRSADAGANVNV